MSTWTTGAIARADLRAFLSDGPQDRPVKLKQIVGAIDGVNVSFLTFDDRIISSTLTVYSNFTPLAASQVTVVDAVLGTFTLATAPALGTTIRAQYYYQLFLDAELDEALGFAAGEIHESDDITSVEFGLKYAAMNYAGHFAYQKQSIRWAHRKSTQFVLEDEPVLAEVTNRSNLYQSLSDKMLSNAMRLRDDFYMRHGRRAAPAFGMIKPTIGPIGPRR